MHPASCPPCAQVLLPVVNVPMIEYTLEWLAAQGVDEVFVFCSSHADQVETYLRESKWNVVDEEEEGGDSAASAAAWKPVVRIERADACTSAGDALRELYARNVVTSDPFVLVSGDVVSNMNLKKAVAEHKARRAKDKSSIMTIVFKKAGATHPTRPLTDDLVVAMDRLTQQVLLYVRSIAFGVHALTASTLTASAPAAAAAAAATARQESDIEEGEVAVPAEVLKEHKQVPHARTGAGGAPR